jgi:hypothetical protein
VNENFRKKGEKRLKEFEINAGKCCNILNLLQETLDLEKKGGGNTFGAITYFLEIADVGEAYLLFEIISVLPKVYSTQIENTYVLCKTKMHFGKTQMCFANQNTFVF